MNIASVRINLLRAAVWLITLLAFAAAAADPPPVLHPATERKSAPAFALKDASGVTVKIEDYRGKVVLLDFWATWCTGCKKELPWFSEFQKTHGPRGFAVVGVSLDEGGWSVLRPYLAHANVPYQMVLGDDVTAKRYGIVNMPDTFLIDRQGRIASAYLARLVDRDDIENKIKELLAEH